MVLSKITPSRIIEALALRIQQRRRKSRLKHTAGAGLSIGHINTLELLDIIARDAPALLDQAIIYDIGANVGTWTLLAKSIFPNSQIHAFEPLDVHTTSFALNCRNLDQTHLHGFCLGNTNSSMVLHVSSFSDSSSLLESTPLEFEQFGIKKEREQTVPVKKAADLIDKKIIPIPDIIKLDVQGYELEALSGFNTYLNSVKYIICEVSFKEYYKGQPQFLEIANYLAGFGLKIKAFDHQTPVGSELNQIDILFKRLA